MNIPAGLANQLPIRSGLLPVKMPMVRKKGASP